MELELQHEEVVTEHMFQRMKTKYNKEYQNPADTLSNSSQDEEDEEEERF